MADPLRILAIHAHPDDVEFQCAGTLALLGRAGHHLTIATMAPGDCGFKELAPQEIAEVRRGEACAAAELIGADYLCVEFRDLSIVVDNDAKRRITEVVRKVRPDLVITAPPVDYMDDHEATSRLVRDGCFNASCPNYVTQQWEPAGPTESIPHLYYVDPLEGEDLWAQPIVPQFYVDISTTYQIKRDTPACHDSQRTWLRAQHGVDEYLESMQRWSSRRGQEVGVEYAEAYRQHLGHPYPRSNLLGELVGDALRTRG